MILDKIQQNIFNHLAAQEYFTASPDIALISELIGDVESEIDARVGAAGGIALLILVVSGKDAKMQATDYLKFGEIEVRLRALVDPTRNNTGVSAWTLAEDAAELCRGFRPLADDPARGETMKLRSIERAEDPAAPVAVDAAFFFSGGRLRVSPPVRPIAYRYLTDENGNRLLDELDQPLTE